MTMVKQLHTRDNCQFQQGDLLEGKYRILRPIAEGGMGAIYHARHEKLGRDVAVKVLKPIANEAPDKHLERVERFFREASFSSQLTHPHTMTIFDYGELPDNGGFFLVMEFLEGKSLREILDAHGALPAATALHIAIQTASSLAEAHHAGVIHRDLKPANIMLVDRSGDPHFVKVVDFGLVKRIHDDDDGDDELTAENTVMGSPTYIAPERFLQKDADGPGVDIYALGIILYEMIVGRPPFIRNSGDTVHQLILKHVQEPPPPISFLRPEIQLPDGLETLIMKCLEKNPIDRVGSMDNLLHLLKLCGRVLGATGTLANWPHSFSLDTPHSSISPINDTAPVGLSRSSEIFLGNDTGRLPGNLHNHATDELTATNLASLPQPAPSQTADNPVAADANTTADTRKTAPFVLVGVLAFLGILAVLAYFTLGNSARVPTTEPADATPMTTSPADNDNSLDDVAPDLDNEADELREVSVHADEPSPPENADAPPAELAAEGPTRSQAQPAKEAVEEPAQAQAPEEPARRETLPPRQEDSVPARPPVQIKLDR